ncbi:MAG: hypothetical protein ACI8RD_008328, partial [Bacillariaceae sp.]
TFSQLYLQNEKTKQDNTCTCCTKLKGGINKLLITTSKHLKTADSL